MAPTHTLADNYYVVLESPALIKIAIPMGSTFKEDKNSSGGLVVRKEASRSQDADTSASALDGSG